MQEEKRRRGEECFERERAERIKRWEDAKRREIEKRQREQKNERWRREERRICRCIEEFGYANFKRQ